LAQSSLGQGQQITSKETLITPLSAVLGAAEVGAEGSYVIGGSASDKIATTSLTDILLYYTVCQQKNDDGF